MYQQLFFFLIGEQSNEVHLPDSNLDNELLVDLSQAPLINRQCPVDQSTTDVLQSLGNGPSIVTPCSFNILVQAPSGKLH